MVTLSDDSEVVDQFEHAGLHCVVVRMHNMSAGTYHCGYVKVADSKDDVDQEFSDHWDGMDVTYNRYVGMIEADELTWSGPLPFDDVDGYYLGFDSAHLWNEKRPHTKTQDSVTERAKEMAEEIKERNIDERILVSAENAGEDDDDN